MTPSNTMAFLTLVKTYFKKYIKLSWPILWYYPSFFQGTVEHLKTAYLWAEGKGKVHPCTGTEALYRPYGPWGE